LKGLVEAVRAKAGGVFLGRTQRLKILTPAPRFAGKEPALKLFSTGRAFGRKVFHHRNLLRSLHGNDVIA